MGTGSRGVSLQSSLEDGLGQGNNSQESRECIPSRELLEQPCAEAAYRRRGRLVTVPDEALRPWTNSGMSQGLRALALVNQLTKNNDVIQTLCLFFKDCVKEVTFHKRPGRGEHFQRWGKARITRGLHVAFEASHSVWGDKGKQGRMERLMSWRTMLCSSDEARLLSSDQRANQQTPH